MSDHDNSSAAIAADLARKLAVAQATPTKPSIQDAVPFVVLRDATGAERLEFLREAFDKPKRKSGIVKLKDAESFITYYGVHGNGSPVYATLEPAQFIAVLNEHTKDEPGWRDHRAVFTVAHSKEWKEWTHHNGSGAAFGSNEAFALFIEENAPDITKPDAAKMLQIALNFRVHNDVHFSVAQRLQDGQIDLGYKNIVEATASSGQGNGKLQIPELFEITVPVFDGLNAKKYKVEARFRYRLRDGKLTLWYELVRPHKVVEAAFKDVWEQIAKASKAPILHGTPE